MTSSCRATSLCGDLGIPVCLTLCPVPQLLLFPVILAEWMHGQFSFGALGWYWFVVPKISSECIIRYSSPTETKRQCCCERAASTDSPNRPSCREGFRALARYLHELTIEVRDDLVCLKHLNHQKMQNVFTDARGNSTKCQIGEL